MEYQMMSASEKLEMLNLNNDFHDKFGFPAEHLVQGYSCSFWSNKSYSPGTLFVSQNYVCFDSKMLERGVVIPFKTIKNISKETTVFTTCILLKTISNKKEEKGKENEFWFGVFIGWGKMDECFLVVQSLWKQQLDRAHFQLDLQLHTSRKSKYLELLLSKQQKQGRKKAEKRQNDSEKDENDQATEIMMFNDLSEYTSNTPSVLSHQSQPTLLRKNSKDMDEHLSSSIFGLKGSIGVTKRLMSAQRTRDYILLFKLPSTEQLLEGYPTPATFHLRENTSVGSLYLSNNFMCFHSQTSADSLLLFVLPFSIVRDISKHNTFGLLGGSSTIKISSDPLVTNPSEFIFSMNQRDRRFAEIWQVGTLSMKRASHQMLTLSSSDLIPIPPRTFINSFSIPLPFSDNDNDNDNNQNEKGDDDGNEDSGNGDGNRLLISSTSTTELQSSADTSISSSSQNNNQNEHHNNVDDDDSSNKEGRFNDNDNEGESNEQQNEVTTTEITKTKSSSSLSSSSSSLSSSSSSLSSSSYNSASEKIWGVMLNDRKQFQSSYVNKQQRQEQLWQRYIAMNGSGVTMLRTQDFSIVCGRSIPDSLRGKVWMFSSGALFKSEIHKGVYQQILTDHQHQQTQATIEIEKDLHRSFPEHPFYQTEEGISSLRRVLVAYSFKNPSIGYCQSMNIVTAFLLLYLPEEEHCFWMLSTICEDILPKYYSSAMVGSLIDQEIFEILLDKHLPAISSHLKQIAFPISVITQPWFLCLFIGFLPIEQGLRIFDCLFSEGVSILFKVCLAMFKLEESVILRSSRMEEIFVLWRQRQWKSSMDDVIYLALIEFGDAISNKGINELRNAVQFSAMEQVAQRSTKMLFRDLKNLSLFAEKEIESLFSRFRGVFPPNSENNNFMEYDVFVKLIDVFCPFWKGHRILIRNAFARWDSNSDGLVDIVDITPGLSVLLKGSLPQRLFLCFSIMDTDRDDMLSFSEFQIALCGATMIYKTNVSLSSEGERSRCDNIFQYANDLFQNYAIKVERKENDNYAAEEELISFCCDGQNFKVESTSLLSTEEEKNENNNIDDEKNNEIEKRQEKLRITHGFDNMKVKVSEIVKIMVNNDSPFNVPNYFHLVI